MNEILSEDPDLRLEDICDACGLPEATIRAYVEEGLVAVQGGDVASWRFSEVSIVRLQKANRLERELRLNPAGAALALELMAEIEDLKNKLRRLQILSRQKEI